MKKRMIIVTALIMGTLGAGCVSVQASDTLPELTKDNALEMCIRDRECFLFLQWWNNIRKHCQQPDFHRNAGYSQRFCRLQQRDIL